MSVRTRLTRTSGGELLCPVCHKKDNLKMIERVNFYVARYQCGICGLTFRLDRTPARDFNFRLGPYGSFTRGIKVPKQFLQQQNIYTKKER